MKQQTLETRVQTLSVDLALYTEKYNNLSKDYQIELEKLNKTILQGEKDFHHSNQAYLDQKIALEKEIVTLSTELQILCESSNNTVVDRSSKISDLTFQLTQKDSQIKSLQDTLLNSSATVQDQIIEANRLRDTIRQLNVTIDSLRNPATPNPVINQPTSVISFARPNMATSELSELVSIHLREKIPHFSGYLGDVSVTDWFKQAERVAKGGNWSKEQMKRYFPERFTKLALSFQERLDDPDNPDTPSSYEDWKEIIIQEFKDPSENQYFKNELAEIKQKPMKEYATTALG
jgi:hypothetical protein